MFRVLIDSVPNVYVSQFFATIRVSRRPLREITVADRRVLPAVTIEVRTFLER